MMERIWQTQKSMASWNWLPNSSCTFSGHACREDVEDSPSFRYRCSGLQIKRVFKKYQQNALQSFPHRVWPSKKHLKRMKAMASSAPSENGLQCYDPITVQPNTAMDHTRRMLDAALDRTSIDTNILQALHETARMFHVAIEKERSLTRGPWFAKAWLGVDHSAWIKPIAYQAAVHALIEAILVISRMQEIKNSFVSSKIQKCLLRLQNPLEESIRQHLCARDPAAEAWLWNQQHPVAVNNLLSNLKEGSHFAAMDTVDSNEACQLSIKSFDFAFFIQSLSTFALIIKLGTGKLSCPAFSRGLEEETGYLMDKLAEFSSIERVYEYTSTIGLKNEFLKHFGLRAALYTSDFKIDKEERLFWVGLIRELLRSSLAREGVRSKLASSSHFEVLDRNLVVFAFFTALGRRARSFLLSRRVQIEEHLSGLLRYLDGGYVIFCQELATLATYQLFVEVASEDLEWLPFFDKDSVRATEKSKNAKGEVQQLPTTDESMEAIAAVLSVCSYWVDDFILYSDKFQKTQSAEVTKFLSNFQSILCQCVTATSQQYRRSESNKNLVMRAAAEMDQVLKSLRNDDVVYIDFIEKSNTIYQLGCKNMQKDFQNTDGILEELHIIEKFLFKLEGLLTGSHLSRIKKGDIHLTAINIHFQKVQRLKKDAHALKSSLQCKAIIKEHHLVEQLQQRHEQKSDYCNASSYKEKDNNNDGESPQLQTRLYMDGTIKTHVLANDSLSNEPLKGDEAGTVNVQNALQTVFEVSSEKTLFSEEVTRLRDLQFELYQLDFRIREYVGVTMGSNEDDANVSHGDMDAVVEKYKPWEFLSRSTMKLKEASMDVLKGTRLLATDIAVAIALVQSRMSGHKLTEREKRILRRTCTDLASVVPIAILMLLPVTAVGHAAMLAAIQKYVPALIPSAYGAERLSLLKQLDQLIEMNGFMVVEKKALLEDSDK